MNTLDPATRFGCQTPSRIGASISFSILAPIHRPLSLVLAIFLSLVSFTSFAEEREPRDDDVLFIPSEEFGRISYRSLFIDDKFDASLSATYHTGEMDRGSWDIPVKFDFNASFKDIGTYYIDDSEYDGFQSEFQMRMEKLGQHVNWSSLTFRFGFLLGESNFDAAAMNVIPEPFANGGPNNTALLDPQGLAGNLGGGITLANIMGFGNHWNLMASSHYEEESYWFGLGGLCCQRGPFSFGTTLSLFFGDVEEDFNYTGQTAIVGNQPTVTYRYDNHLETDRFGFQIGWDTGYDAGNLFGTIPVKLFSNVQLRFVSNEAWASSTFTTDALGGIVSTNDRIEHDWSDIGLVAGVGITFGIAENVELSTGVYYESWDIPALEMTASQPFSISEVERETVSFAVGVKVQF